MLSAVLKQKMSFLLLIIGPLVSLAISPNSNFDPINLVKLLFLVSISASLLFFAFIYLLKFRSELVAFKWFLIFCASFFFSLLTSLFLSEAPLTQQVWGVFGRSTGLVTYVSLLIILIATSFVSQINFYHKLVLSLIFTSVPMTLYAVVQVFGKDPVSWSEMAPFATLGNINFSSAFFGLASLSSCVLALNKEFHPVSRLSLLSLSVIQLLIVTITESIQGIMIFFAGIGVVGFLLLKTHLSRHPKQRTINQLLLYAYTTFSFISAVGVIAALFNIGPLARLVYQPSVLFRFDYWHAGLEMSLQRPLFGVGLDSYGDWYRAARGEISTLRTGPDRITNTAHNIYLDLSASGGFPLLISYLLILAFALRSAFRVLQRNAEYSLFFVALFASWVAYLIQAAVSINQVGVGIWGWLFTGALIGYERSTSLAEAKGFSRRSNNSSSGMQLPAGISLLSIFSFFVGFAIAFVPFNADSRFKDALESGDPSAQFAASKKLGATAYHMELTLDAAIKANNEGLATEIVDELIQRYPRNFMAWRVKQVLSTSTPDERIEAYEMLKAMDPFNPDIQPNQ